jgi:hypothetical protein
VCEWGAEFAVPLYPGDKSGETEVIDEPYSEANEAASNDIEERTLSDTDVVLEARLQALCKSLSVSRLK